MTVKYYFLIQIVASLTTPAMSQNGARLSVFPELVMTEIAGAPNLNEPILITGTSRKVTGQGHGWAAPAYYDWDADGLKDLLIGEFGSGQEFGHHMGNFVRVYLNTGSEAAPEFTNFN